MTSTGDPAGPLLEQLGPVTTELLAELYRRGVPCWLDSGTLLGAVRDGALPAWDKDIDLGAWVADARPIFDACRAACETSGWSYVEKRLDGQPYAIVLRPPPFEVGKNVPVAIHQFRIREEHAESEQPHLMLAHGARYAHARLGITDDSGFTERVVALARHLRTAPALVMVVALVQLRLGRLVGYLVHRWERRHTHEGVLCPHPSESRLFRWFYERFLWRVPSHHFTELSALDERLPHVRVPDQAESYLERRYQDWRIPVQNWFYVLDDGCLTPKEPTA
jgi:hypothetical protein